MNKFEEKAKNRRTRQAEIDGDAINICVYSSKEFKDLLNKIIGGSDEDVARILADQFLDDSLKPVFTPEFLLSTDCTNVFIVELSNLFIDVNAGRYKKKE